MSRARTIVPFLLLASSIPAGPALAVDGVVQINQADVAAGGITPADTPGFPATIDRSGSYVLTSNLSVPAATHGVEITAPGVTLDLNGFTIAGPTRIICPIEGCPPNDGVGVSGSSRTRVYNGMVRTMGSHGVRLGSESSVENVTATENGGAGISLGQSSIVDRCIATENGSNGIAAGFYSIVTNSTAVANSGDGFRMGSASNVRGNTARGNGADGIFAPGSVIENNRAVGNTGFGIAAVDSSSVIGNSLFFNSLGGISMTGSGYVHNVLRSNGDLFTSADEISGGVPMGTNICDAAPCP